VRRAKTIQPSYAPQGAHEPAGMSGEMKRNVRRSRMCVSRKAEGVAIGALGVAMPSLASRFPAVNTAGKSSNSDHQHRR
jgi:hypothetical protein